MPAERVLTNSWRDNSICCARLIASHIGVLFHRTLEQAAL
jgi:hypothetical protein